MITEILLTDNGMVFFSILGDDGGFVVSKDQKRITDKYGSHVIDREDKESNKNSLSSKDKVESGIYVPSRPPKKLGGKEADEADTTIKIS